MKIVIGLVGEKGAGKGTFHDELWPIACPTSVGRHSSGKVIGEFLDFWGIPKTRENLQRMPVLIEENFGRGLLTEVMRKRILALKDEVVIFDGVRWKTDVAMLRSLEKTETTKVFIIYITAPPEMRFARLKRGREKLGEKEMTWEQFLREEKAKTEKFIREIGMNESDFTIVNDEEGFERIEAKIKEFWTKTLEPLLVF